MLAAPRTAAQVAAIAELTSAAEDLPDQRTRRPVEKFAGPLTVVSKSGNRLIQAPAIRSVDRLEGMRIVDVGYIDKALAPHLSCQHCNVVGKLICSREHERPAGLSSTLVWVCTECGKPALQVATSRPLPRKPEQKGPHRRQINAQLVMFAYHFLLINMYVICL